MNCMTGELMAVKELPLQGLPGEDATVSSLQVLSISLFSLSITSYCTP
jgi:hypothetical protein